MISNSISHDGVTTWAHLIFIWPREETSGLQLSCSGFVATLLKEVQVPCDTEAGTMASWSPFIYRTESRIHV